MKINWQEFIGQTVNITMNENYGMQMDPRTETPVYEIVFKSGKLINAYDEGLLLETTREKQQIKIFVPFSSVKCIEFFNF